MSKLSKAVYNTINYLKENNTININKSINDIIVDICNNLELHHNVIMTPVQLGEYLYYVDKVKESVKPGKVIKIEQDLLSNESMWNITISIDNEGSEKILFFNLNNIELVGVYFTEDEAQEALVKYRLDIYETPSKIENKNRIKCAYVINKCILDDNANIISSYRAVNYMYDIREEALTEASMLNYTLDNSSSTEKYVYKVEKIIIDKRKIFNIYKLNKETNNKLLMSFNGINSFTYTDASSMCRVLNNNETDKSIKYFIDAE